jgi:hypothetical protein
MLVARGTDARIADEALTQAGVAGEPEERDADRTAALALSSLSRRELEGLRRALEELADRLETRSDPMVEDLDESDPMAPFARLLRTFLPTLTACSAIGARRQVAPDGTMVAAVAMECDAGAVASEARDGAEDAPATMVACIPLWQPAPAERYVRRARFLEWPLAAAVVLGFTDARHARDARDQVRESAHDAGSRVAVVLDGEDLGGARNEAVDAVRVPAERVVALIRRGRPDHRVPERAHVLELLANAPPSGAAPVPWLRLDPEEVLVVPKLSALADLETFASDVERALPANTRVEWVRRPEPIR